MTAIGTLIGRGVVASRPAAGIAGQLYFATDVSGGTLQRDNGSTWDAVEGAGASASLATDSDTNISAPANLNQLQYQTGDSKWHNVAGGMVWLDEKVATGSATLVTFSSISGAYRHLRIVFQARSDIASSGVLLALQFNGDTGGNYDSIRSQIASSAITETEFLGSTLASVGFVAAASSPVNAAGAGEIRIPYYAGTAFRKTYTADSFVELLDTTGNVSHYVSGGDWRSTAAITSITLFLPSGNGNLVSGSTFSLYGIV